MKEIFTAEELENMSSKELEEISNRANEAMIEKLSDKIDIHTLASGRYVVCIKGMAITVNRTELDRLYRQIAVVNQKEAQHG